VVILRPFPPGDALAQEPSERPWWVEWPLRDGPWALLAAVTATAVTIAAAFGPIRDIDLFWHLLAGDAIRTGTPIREAGRGWSFASTVPDTWVSSQWLAELLLSWIHELGGFPALVAYRVLTTALTLLVLTLVCLRRRSAIAGAIPFTIAAIALASTTQERSQQLTFILAPLVGWWAERLWRTGRLPRWYVVLPLTVGWANFHGGWVILPLSLGLAAVARWVDHGWRDRVAPKAVGLALGCFFASMISPLGPANSITAFTFSKATAQIAEWKQVEFWNPQALSLIGLLLIAVVAWSLGRSRPKLGELILTLGLIGFGFLAYRDITPSVLLLAPVATGIITRALPDTSSPPASPDTPAPLRRWTRHGTRLGRTSLAIGMAATIVALAFAFRSSAIAPVDAPMGLYQRIADHPGPVKVLNTYNLAGPLLFYGGRPPHVRVGIDGRTERYGADYIQQYNDVLFGAQPGWTWQFEQLDPDAVLVYSNQALSAALVAERRWQVIDSQSGIQLLVPPNAKGWN
jgi:hypothetical protein